MKRHAWACAAALSILVGGVGLRVSSAAAGSQSDLSAKPTVGACRGRGPVRLFVSLHPGRVAFERPRYGPRPSRTGSEQCQLNPGMIGCPAGAAANSQSARAARKRAGDEVFGRQGRPPSCPASSANTMAQGKVGGYPRSRQRGPDAAFCEEVFVNPPEATFVTQNSLTTLSGQQKYGSTQGGAITFPSDAVEIKADWVPASSYKANQTFKCPDTTGTLYTEVINGTCYALVGFHISSKVLPDWLWATFEPNSAITNPELL